jgi:beta-lactamase class A
MLNRKIPLYFLIIAALAVAGTMYLLRNSRLALPEIQLSTPAAAATSCSFRVDRLNGYKHIRPLLFVERACETDNYYPLKSQLAEMISGFKSQGIIASASVYVRIFKNGEWFGLNEDEKYDPASLMKVPILITWLRMEEDHPGTLNRVLVMNAPVSNMKKQEYGTDKTQIGHGYKVKDLLRSMITESDNMATALLNRNMDSVYFKNTFMDLGLREPGWNDTSYPITVAEYSRFMQTIYNATYLTIKDSEYAAELLTHTEFTKGIARELPTEIAVSHKFGEAGDADMHQLHESGIVFLNSTPYIITIMTRGRDLEKLPDVLSHISKVTYDYMNAAVKGNS